MAVAAPRAPRPREKVLDMFPDGCRVLPWLAQRASVPRIRRTCHRRSITNPRHESRKRRSSSWRLSRVAETPMLERGMSTFPDFSTLDDRQLLCAVKTVADHESRSTARLIALLAEVDARRLYLGEGYASLFTYCTQVLHLSEHAAYGRIEAARAALKYPLILERLAERSITLTTVTLLARHLTEANHREILDAAQWQTKREVEQLAARLAPQPDVVASVRKLPVQSAVQSEPAAVNIPVDVFAMVVTPPQTPARQLLRLSLRSASKCR
jgi:hypothetical protein